ncbi:MAG: Radical family RiPP maturation amino acid epimerase [Pseudomonadota bacterium]|nr:Radical family RiPP maturation amino acid epimerase [Pseudomonadota bacterium]
MFLNDMYQGFGPGEIKIIANFKRLIERYRGDPEFRRTAVEYPTQRDDLLMNAGITLDRSTREVLWKRFEDGQRFSLVESDLIDHPELRLFADWSTRYEQHLHDLKDQLNAVGHLRLAAWRNRHIQRFVSENMGAEQVVSPFLAYELSKGCSVGCWFCGFSAERLQGYFPYTAENARLWQNILNIGQELYGPVSQFSLCYHGTDPFDNPDYFLFLHDYFACYGLYPQTTTALPLKKLSMTREMLRLREKSPTLPDRFSVLSLSILRKIHETFSPVDLRYVELVLQNPGALGLKSSSGRARNNPQKVATANRPVIERYAPASAGQDALTNECLCGYLVNLVDRTIKLISPCPSSDQWPNGYRIHAQRTFRDAAEYRAFLEQSMTEWMPDKLAWQDPISFRSDLVFTRLEEGFSLTSRVRRHTLTGKSWYALLGELIAGDELSVMEITSRLASAGASLPEVASLINRLFDKGLLQEPEISPFSPASGLH